MNIVVSYLSYNIKFIPNIVKEIEEDLTKYLNMYGLRSLNSKISQEEFDVGLLKIIEKHEHYAHIVFPYFLMKRGI